MFDCPFCCGFATPSSYQIQLHVEEQHIADSGFATRDDESLTFAIQLQQEEEDALKGQTLDGASRSLALSLQRETFPVQKARSTENHDDDDIPYFECLEPGCGEFVHLIDFNEHLDLHASSDPSLDADSPNTITNKMFDTDSGYGTDPHHSLPSGNKRNREAQSLDYRTHIPAQGGHHKEIRISRTISPFLSESSQGKIPSKSPARTSKHIGRLGKNELGPYAYEERMPRRLHNDLKRGGLVRQVNRIGSDGNLYRETFIENEVRDTVTALSILSSLSTTVAQAFFCHTSVQHVFKRRDEGGFCGYRNIQMLISYIQGAKAQGWNSFGRRVPGVLDIQDMVEEAWDKGIDTLGRIQTGGVRDTRKWIGTPEACAVMKYFQIPCEVGVHSTRDNEPAHENLLDLVEAYFCSKSHTSADKVHMTLLPPIYLQQPGHSLTIVGLERRKDGSRNLIVLDPSFGPSATVQELAMNKRPRSFWNEQTVERMLKPYRRGEVQLGKFDSFETLRIIAPPAPST